MARGGLKSVNVVMVDESTRPAKGSFAIDISIHVRVRVFSRASRFGPNLSPSESRCAHAPVVEKAGGLLESRAHRELPDPLMRFSSNIRRLVAASVLCVAFAQGASATGVEPAKDMRLDPALCLAAALARDDNKT